MDCAPPLTIRVDRDVEKDRRIGAAQLPEHIDLCGIPVELCRIQLCPRFADRAVRFRIVFSVVTVHHDQSLDDFAFFRDGDDVISVAESRVALFIATVRVSETKVGNRIDHRRSSLVVVIAPDGSPRNAERIDSIRQRLVRLHVAGPRKIARDRDEIGVDTLDKGVYGIA